MMAEKSVPADFERILLPTDFTEASEHAALYALNMATKYNARLYVLDVVDLTEDAAGFYVPHLSFDNLDKEMLKAAEGMLEKFCAKQFNGFDGLEMKVVAGEPYKDILKAVDKDGIDIVVMGTCGKGGIERFFFGSTTERVLREADCPVLVIPPRSKSR